jgi:hypothetical protein
MTEPDQAVSEGRDYILRKARDVQQVLLDNFLDVKRRNEAMLFRTLPPRVLASLGSTVMDIQVMIFPGFVLDMLIRFSAPQLHIQHYRSGCYTVL